MKKIVINEDFGGFGLSKKAMERLIELGNKEVKAYMKEVSKDNKPSLSTTFDAFYPDIERDNPDLIKVVEELGDEANSSFASLKVVEIPDDVDWEIQEYDGREWIAEKHRTWS